MKILIVEDNKTKQDLIIELIDLNYNCLINLDFAMDLEEANAKIETNNYDVYILDLSIKSEHHEASIEYGLQLFDNLFQKTANIIIYSTVDNFQKSDRYEEFIKNGIPFINYTSKGKDWEIKLLEYLEKFICIEDLSYDMAIITALDDEFKWMLLASETKWYDFEIDDYSYKTTKIRNDEGNEVSVVAFSIGKMGIAYSSSFATKILMMFKPKLLVMTGICAGLEGATDKGDIVIPEYIFNYQEGDITADGFVPAFKNKQLDVSLSKLVKKTKDLYIIDIKNDWERNFKEFGSMPGHTFKLVNEKHFGTGSGVVKDETILNDIKKYNQKDIVGLDMEGYSIFIACETLDQLKCKPILIKAVQDFANKEKDKTYRNFGSYASARYFFRLCTDRLITKLVN